MMRHRACNLNPGILSASCELLESRRLLAGPDIGVFYDANDNGQFESSERLGATGLESRHSIDLGAVVSGEDHLSHRLRVVNEGGGILTFHVTQTNGQGGFYRPVKVDGTELGDPFELLEFSKSGGEKLDFRVRTPTTDFYVGELISAISIDSDDPDEPLHQIEFSLRVFPDSLAATQDLGLVSGDQSKSTTFLLTGGRKGDLNGNNLLGISDQVFKFELPAGSKTTTELSLSGIYRADTQLTFAAPRVYVAKDDGDGKLSATEREQSIAMLDATPALAGGSPDVSRKSVQLSGGKYLIYVTAVSNPGGTYNGNGDQMLLDTTLGLKVQVLPAAQIIVTGKDNGIGAQGEAPTTANGTSFGEFTPGGDAPVLEFKLKNSGGSVLNLFLGKPDVSGDGDSNGVPDFAVLEGLPASIPKGQTRTFKIRLADLAPGPKAGQVYIKSDAAQTDFIFKIAGTVKDAPQPEAFVIASGNKITIEGTSRNDVIAINAPNGVLTIVRNGVTNPATFSVKKIKGITVNCGSGNDIVRMKSSLKINTIMNGGKGNDDLQSAKGNDSLFGGDGLDTLNGAAGSDLLDGAKGNDSLTSGAGQNTLKGGAGDDELFCRNGVRDIVDGGKGSNTVTGDIMDSIQAVQTRQLT
jgi:Ca2+-binding RTX toxin-like protein